MSKSKNEDDIRVLTPAELMAWVEDNTQVMRLRTFRDAIPGGYMAAMAPLLVDWRSVDTDSAEHDVILRNVNLWRQSTGKGHCAAFAAVQYQCR